MRRTAAWMLAIPGLCLATRGSAQITAPRTVIAGAAVTVGTAGSGKADLYLLGPGQALHREVQRGEAAGFAAGELSGAGHYLLVLTGGSGSETAELDVMPARQPASLSFLAKPSRLPVGLHNGISGAAYVLDTYRNLIVAPTPVSFELSTSSGVERSRSVTTHNGLAWAEMDSTPKRGVARFVARAGGIAETRIIDQVPGDPCRLSISARPLGDRLEVETEPVHDCSGNAVPDGTIVTFTETVEGRQSTVDVPIKQGFARVTLPAYPGAKIAVASGVVAGNEIRWGGR